jgi:simple sugar transport system permease protein
MNKQKKKRGLSNYSALIASIFAVIVGLIIGYIVMLVANPSEATAGFITIITGPFTHGAKGVGQIFYYATPIILTGLSVGFAFRTGLFNIGASGQFYLGALGAVWVGITMESLGGVHWVVALLVAILFGAFWGFIPGFLKAFFNVNEVIASIMLNYVGLYITNWIVKSSPVLFNRLRNESYPVKETAQIPKWGLDKIFPDSSVHAGIIIAIVVVVIIYIILEKTTFGFELKAVGFNKDASKYAGINEKKGIILSMTIAGAISGLAGGLVYLAASGRAIEVVDVLAGEGFTGISVALLGNSQPFGVLAAGIFIAFLYAGGYYLQLFNFSTEIIDIIIAIIIYFSAFALFIRHLLFRMRFNREKKLEAARLAEENKDKGGEN